MNALSRASSALAIGLLALGLAGASASAAPATAKRKPSAAAARGARPQVLPFISDDYAKALAEARARRVPIFIEAWAPW
jgi:hypothetical protein